MTPNRNRASCSFSCRSGISRILVIAAIGGFAMLVALGIRLYVSAAVHQMRLDPTALPRPKIPAPYIQSEHEVVDVMLETARIDKDDMVYDLGCGDGRLVVGAAKKYGCRGVGFDKDPERVKEARAKVVEEGLEDLVRIEEADVFTLDLSEADVVLAYLLPWMLKDLIPQFAALKPGSRIVSHDFTIEGIQMDEEVEVPVGPQKDRHLANLYITPLKPEKKK